MPIDAHICTKANENDDSDAAQHEALEGSVRIVDSVICFVSRRTGEEEGRRVEEVGGKCE